jgi:hypothetical protein
LANGATTRACYIRDKTMFGDRAFDGFARKKRDSKRWSEK